MKDFNYYLTLIFSNNKFAKFKTIKPILEQLRDQYDYINEHELVLNYDEYLNINCNNCEDCIMCIECNNCDDCINCKNCINSDKCRNCTLCEHCICCRNCHNCFKSKHLDNASNKNNENGLRSKITAGIIGLFIFALIISSPFLSYNWFRLL